MQSPPSSLAVLTDIQARRSGRYLTIRASRPLACPPPPLVTADAAAAGFGSQRVVEGHYSGEPQTSISGGRVLPGQVEQRTVLGGGDVVPVLAKKTTKSVNSDDVIMKKKQKDISSTVLGRKEKAKPSTIFQLFHSAIANSKGGNRGEPIHNKQPALLPPEQEQIMRDQPKQHTTAEIKISPMQQAASTKEAEEEGCGEEYSYYGNSSSNPFAAASAMFEDLDLF
mmetsp:Transcript_24354/g.38419  ORF Transcript_24354/g.38419 Transcript_24354/m.38419 type:complete len:225 (+) Transcript_24354:1-675(+)